MKVLILHQHFKTPMGGGAIRSYYLAKGLIDRHIQVSVITAHNDSVYKIENIEGIDVHYLPIAYDNRFGFGARVSSFMKYVWGVMRIAHKFSDADFCYAISVPLTVGIAAKWINRKFKIPFFFEVGDLWPDAPAQLGFIQNYFLLQSLHWLEREIYRSAQVIVALSPAIRENVLKKVPGKPVHLIPNMGDCDFFQPGPKTQGLEEKFATQERFVVSYMGAIGVANGLDYFLECANACRKTDLPISFLMCGDGALLERLKKSSAQLKLQNLNFVPFTNRDGVKEIMNVTDAVFVCYKNVPILETGSPNKFFDGLAAGKLIVINFGGWIRKEIEDNRCGMYLDPTQPTDFVKKITSVVRDAKLLGQYQTAARALAEKKYSRTELSERFANLFMR